MQGVLILEPKQYGRARTRWHQTRHEGINASEIPAILGVDPFNSPLSLWLKKTGPVSTDDEQNEAMELGHLLEDSVARLWARRRKAAGRTSIILPTPGILAHPDHPWLRCTIDRFFSDRRGGRPLGVLEVKTTSQDWAEDNDAPNHVVAQVQTQLAVTGLDIAYVAALHLGPRRNRFRQWRIERDDDLIDEIIKAAADFKFAVEFNEPPMPIGHEADAEALALMFPGDYELADVELPDDLIADRRNAAEQLKSWTDDLELYDQQIKARMGDSTTAVDTAGRPVFTWKPSTSGRLDQKALKAERPDIYNQFRTDTTSRRFLQKKVK